MKISYDLEVLPPRKGPPGGRSEETLALIAFLAGKQKNMKIDYEDPKECKRRYDTLRNYRGSRKDLVFNWTAITSQVCKELGIPPFLLAAAMPDMVRDYEGCLGDVTRIAVPVPSKERGGGTT